MAKTHKDFIDLFFIIHSYYIMNITKLILSASEASKNNCKFAFVKQNPTLHIYIHIGLLCVKISKNVKFMIRLT